MITTFTWEQVCEAYFKGVERGRQQITSEKGEAELPATDNTSSPKLPEWEEVLDKVTQWWLRYDTDEKASVYNIARKVYNIIAGKIGL